MQKHSDRPDKRPSLQNIPPGSAVSAGAVNQQGQTQSNNSAASAAAAAAAAAGLTSMPGGQTSQLASEASYWPKMDPATAAYAAATAHDRDYGSLMDPRLNPHRDMMDPRHHMEDLRAHQGQFGGGNGGYGDHTVGGNGNIKTSSAFSPIQGSMLQASAAAQGFMGGSRGYSFYDPIGFPKHHSQVLY
jgi:hypothetical protein